MPIKPFVHITPKATSQIDEAAAYAVSMAETIGAHLTSLVFAFDFTKPLVFYGDTPDEEIEKAREHLRRAAEHATATFADNAKSAGILYERAIKGSFSHAVPDVIVDYAKLHDLTISGPTPSSRSSL